MHMRAPGEYLRGKDRQRGVLAAIRQHLKKANYHNFQDLVAAFKHYDKVSDDTQVTVKLTIFYSQASILLPNPLSYVL